MSSSRSRIAVRPATSWLEWGLDLAALAFLPVLVLASHGLAGLEAIAGVLALGLVVKRTFSQHGDSRACSYSPSPPPAGGEGPNPARPRPSPGQIARGPQWGEGAGITPLPPGEPPHQALGDSVGPAHRAVARGLPSPPACGGRGVKKSDVVAPAALLVFLVLWGAVSAAWSPNAVRSLLIAARLAGLFAAGLALVAAVPAIAEPRRLVRWFFAGIALGVAILAVQRMTGGLLTRPFFVRGFVAPQLNQASDTLAVLALPAGASLWYWRRPGAAALLVAAAAAAIYGLVGTAAQVSFAAGLVAAPLFHRWRAVLAPAAALVSVLVIVTAPLSFARLARDGPLLHLTDHFKSSVPHRLLIWSFVGDRIAEKPLLGWGLDAARAIPGGTEWIRPGQPWLPLHPHNAWLQVWLELGVPGIVLFSLIVARLWLGLGAAPWPPPFAAAGAGALAAAFTETLATYGVWEEWWVGTLWFALFLILVMARTVPTVSATGSSGRGRRPRRPDR